MKHSESSEVSAAPKRVSMSGFQWMLLLLILVCAAGLRLYNVAWDSGTMPHPDERSTVAFYAPTIELPDSWSTALDPRQSPLNPFWDTSGQHRRSYTYGHFPLYVLVLAAAAVQELTSLAAQIGLPESWVLMMTQARSPTGFAYLGRFLMALADTGSVFLIFLLGRRLYGTWAGLLAAALSAFTVLQIQLAHFFAVDPVSATFTFLALYGSILMMDRRKVGAAILTGVGIGLAVSSKFSAIPIIVAPALATLLTYLKSGEEERNMDAGRLVGNLVVAGIVSLAVFAVTSPFVFLDFQNFWQAVVKEQGDMVSGMVDMPFTRQYRGTVPYFYFLKEQVLWGMGIPLGLLSLAGLGWVLWRVVRGRLLAGEWIVLSWVILYFGTTGLFLAKFVRYMAPVVPLLILFGTGFVIWVGRQLPISEDLKSPGSHHGWGLWRYLVIGVVLLASILWSVSFVNGVYATEHSWVTASRWVYQNVPDGACIVGEHWDEGLPRSWAEPGMSPAYHGYWQPLLPMYEEDTRQKFETIRGTLTDCDYVVLASNRLWRTIPRLAERYPMSTRYYEHLFSGELGFEPVYELSTPPRLGPLVIDDQIADESFTVYDHPKPMVFQKVRQLSDAEWETLLGGEWQGAVPGYVGPPTLLTRLRGGKQTASSLWRSGGQTGGGKEHKPLLLDRPVDELPVVDDYGWNNLANWAPWVAIVVWWLAIQIIGWLAWPLTRRLFRNLPDQAYLLSKSLGWLLLGFGVWLASSFHLLPNALSTVIIVLLAMAAIGIWLGLRDKDEIRSMMRSRATLIWLGEGLFGLAFLGFVGLRILNPDLWQPWNGGEKMLEIGFLNAIVKSSYMPPYDPYFAGGYINYYYYGLFLVGVLVKMTGIQPSIAFNLAVPTLAALTVVNVFSLGYNLSYHGRDTHLAEDVNAGGRFDPDGVDKKPSYQSMWRAIVVGLLAVLFVVLIGNLAGFNQLVKILKDLAGSGFENTAPILGDVVPAIAGLKQIVLEGAKLPPYNYWDPTRAIPNTINEFPYFSFIFADLHPHMIGIPFTVLLLVLSYSLMKRLMTNEDSGGNVPAAALPVLPQVSDGAESDASAATSAVAIPENSSSGTESGRLSQGLVLEALHELSWGAVLRWLAIPFCLGALAVINTWDLPTYLGIATLAFWLGRYRKIVGRVGTDQPDLRRVGFSVVEAAVFGGVTLIASYLLYLPFFLHYQALDVGLGLVMDKTDLGQFVSIWGLVLFAGSSYLLFTLVHPRTRMGALRATSLFLRRWNVFPHLAHMYGMLVRNQRWLYRLGVITVPAAVGIAVGLWLAGYRVPAILAPLVVLAFLFLLRPEPDSGHTFAGLLLFTGLLILLGVEVFYLRDFLGGSTYYRMNTLFKFYIQVWVILGIVSALIVAELWRQASQADKLFPGVVWQGLVVLLVAASLVYPVLGTPTRLTDRFPQVPAPIGTLDGTAYMTTGTLYWPEGNAIELDYDHQAIKWLQDNVKGTPVLAEAKIGFYREGGMRVSSYTGLPMPLGGLHQSEQRWSEQIGPRDGQYMEFWNTDDPERAWGLIQDMDISYIYLGQLERTLYDPNITDSLRMWGVTNFAPTGYSKFQTLVDQGRLELVYQNERTRIYRVRGD